MRVPLAVNLESRDGSLDKDALIINGLVESRGEGVPPVVRKRPGVADVGQVDTGVSQLITEWFGLRVIIDDTLSSGTVATIVSSPTTSALTVTEADLQFSAAATAEGAATPRLMFKNKTNGFTMVQAGTVSAISYGATMGSATYTLTSLTQTGGTATATAASMDEIDVGDSVTIAGATPSDYNGAKTVLTKTEGSYTPARTIPITITRSGTTATATTVSGNHGLTTATAYTIAGANESAYNGSKTITKTSDTTFTYTVTVTPATAIKWNSADKTSGVTLSGSDLTAALASPAAVRVGVRATVGRATATSKKYYFEVKINSFSGTYNYSGAGICSSSYNLSTGAGGTYAYFNVANSTFYNNEGTGVGTSTAVSAGDVLGFALDCQAGNVKVFLNGTEVGSGGLNGMSGTMYPWAWAGSSGSESANVTVRLKSADFTQTPPTGFTAWEFDDPESPATGSITVTDPAVTVNPTFTFSIGAAVSSPATGTITATVTGGTVPGIAYINGYFCVMDVNGNIYSSASDDPTSFPALNVVVAQNEPGAGKAMAKSGNYLVAFKEWSSEFFYDAGNPTGSPFSPVENGFTLIGCAQGWSVAPVGSSLLWIAQTRKHRGRSVYLMDGLEQRKVSTAAVDRILDDDDLATVYAYGLSVDGHPVYVLTLVTSAVTLVYDLVSGVWSTWSYCTIGSSKSVSSLTRSGSVATVTTSTAHTLTDGDPVKISGATQTEYNGTHLAKVNSTTEFEIDVADSAVTPATGTIVAYPYTESYFPFIGNAAFQGVDFLLHASTGHLMAVDSAIGTDNDGPVNFFIRSQRLDGGSNGRKRLASASLISTKENDYAGIRWSDDDCASYTAYRTVDLSTDDPTLRRCGAFRRRTFELRHVGDGMPVFEALELNAGEN